MIFSIQKPPRVSCKLLQILGNRPPYVEALGLHEGEGPSNAPITILYLQVMQPFNLEF